MKTGYVNDGYETWARFWVYDRKDIKFLEKDLGFPLTQDMPEQHFDELYGAVEYDVELQGYHLGKTPSSCPGASFQEEATIQISPTRILVVQPGGFDV